MSFMGSNKETLDLLKLFSLSTKRKRTMAFISHSLQNSKTKSLALKN